MTQLLNNRRRTIVRIVNDEGQISLESLITRVGGDWNETYREVVHLDLPVLEKHGLVSVDGDIIRPSPRYHSGVRDDGIDMSDYRSRP